MSGNGFVKGRVGAPEGFYAVEAAGLAWLCERDQDDGRRQKREQRDP